MYENFTILQINFIIKLCGKLIMFLLIFNFHNYTTSHGNMIFSFIQKIIKIAKLPSVNFGPCINT